MSNPDPIGRPGSSAPESDAPPVPAPSLLGAADERDGKTDIDGLHRLLVEAVQDYGIFLLQPTGHVASWNEGAARIKGYTASEVIGRHFSIFYPADKVAGAFPEFELAVASREGRFEDEGWRVRKDGTQFWANVVITALRGDDQTLVGFAKVTRDLTERRAAEEQRVVDAQRVAAAEASNRTKSEFLMSMSHELRTPLNAIGGYADLLAEGVYGPLETPQLQAVDRIRRSQQHLLSVISDLLNFGGIEAGRMVYDIAPVPVVAMLDTVRTMIEPQTRHHQIRFDVQDCYPIVIARVDQARAEQILLNLLSNAVKFTPDGGAIDVHWTMADAHVAVHVRDTGPGIPLDKLDVIFEPFVQLGRALNRPHEGTGLGLAISRNLARAMGGDVTAASAPGSGATFTLVLPRA